jgi:hypothetical protein
MKADGELLSHYLSNWQKYQTIPEIDFIKKCVRISIEDREFVQSPICFVNIGAGAGTSTAAILEATDEGIVFSIDIESVGNEVNTNEHLRFAEAGIGLDGRVIRIWGDSRIVGRKWPVKNDLVLVDGGHLEDEISEDIKIWLPTIPSGGVIMFHDYNSRYWPHVKMVVDSIMFEKYEYLGLVDTMIAFRIP